MSIPDIQKDTMLWGLCVVLMAAILAVDLTVPLGLAMGIPYVAVILLSLWLSGKATLLITVLCSGLTLGAYFVKPPVPEQWKAITNRSLTVLVILVTAALGLQLKKAEKKHEEALRERERALGELRILQGLLPICSACKKIRNNQGDWTQMETYIREHSEADFTHGICPECRQKLYPELANSHGKGQE